MTNYGMITKFVTKVENVIELGKKQVNRTNIKIVEIVVNMQSEIAI